MEAIILFAACTAIFFILNRTRLNDLRASATPGAWASFAVTLACSAGLAAFSLCGAEPFYFVPFMWAAYAVTAAPAMKLGRAEPLYVTAFLIAVFSFLMLPYSRLTPLAFLLSLVIMLAMLAPVYRQLLAGGSILPAGGLFVLTAMAVNAGVTGRFGPYISLPASLLCAVFLHVRRSEPAPHYAQDVNAVNSAGVVLALLVVQLAVGVFLKSPLFGQ